MRKSSIFYAKKQTVFSQSLYRNHLLSINNIHFTRQEVDVIACVLIARKTSKIVYFLSMPTANSNFEDLENNLTSVLDKRVRKFHGWLVLSELIGNKTREDINAAVHRRSVTRMG